MHAQVVWWAEKGSVQEDTEKLGIRIGTLNIPIALAKPKALIILFIFMEKKKAFVSQK